MKSKIIPFLELSANGQPIQGSPTTNTPEEFLDWLEDCPLQWSLDKQDDESLTCTFIKPEVED